MTDPAQIARSLTKAQRRSLAQPPGIGRPMAYPATITQARILYRLGLTEYPGYVTDLTPLGVEVRHIVEATPDA